MKKWLQKYRFFVFAAMAIAAIAGILGYSEYNRKLPDTYSLKTAFSLTSDELIRQFEANESKATARYADKVIRVEGVILSIQSTDSRGTVFLNDGSSLASVICEFDRKSFHEIQERKKGDPVIIKGVCSGYLMDVILLRCIVEK